LAVSTIAYKPELTKEQAKEIFGRHFEGKYTVEDWKGVLVGARRDFVLVKSAFVGVSVKLEQGRDQTKFVYVGYAPKLWARALTGLGLFAVVMNYLLWNGLTNEVKDFIETAAELR
jgi:hypothetical protein